LDVLHRVVDGEQTRDLATRRVDVDRDVLVGVFALEVEQLRHHQVGDSVVDRGAEEDDAFLEQSRVDVERALTAVGLLDDGGDQVVADGLGHSDGSSFASFSSLVSAASPSSGELVSGKVRSTGFPSSSTTSAWSTRKRNALPRARSERSASIAPRRS